MRREEYFLAMQPFRGQNGKIVSAQIIKVDNCYLGFFRY